MLIEVISSGCRWWSTVGYGAQHESEIRTWGRLEEEGGQLPITLGNVQRKNKQIDTLEGLVQLQDEKDTADIFQKRICHEH